VRSASALITRWFSMSQIVVRICTSSSSWSQN